MLKMKDMSWIFWTEIELGGFDSAIERASCVERKNKNSIESTTTCFHREEVSGYYPEDCLYISSCKDVWYSVLYMKGKKRKKVDIAKEIHWSVKDR